MRSKWCKAQNDRSLQELPPARTTFEKGIYLNYWFDDAKLNVLNQLTSDFFTNVCKEVLVRIKLRFFRYFYVAQLVLPPNSFFDSCVCFSSFPLRYLAVYPSVSVVKL